MYFTVSLILSFLTVIELFKNINMKKFFEHKYAKDYMYLIGAVLVGLTAVMGGAIADYAKTPFWWKFWGAAGVAAWIIWIAVFVVLWNAQKRK
jgi:hypothetical protein